MRNILLIAQVLILLLPIAHAGANILCHQILSGELRRQHESKSLPENVGASRDVGSRDDLWHFRQIYGREFRRATEFEVEYMTRDEQQNWYSYQDLEVAFFGKFQGYGVLIFRTPEKTQYFALDAELPKARQIIADLLPRVVPNRMHVSEDGMGFHSNDPDPYRNGSYPSPEGLNKEYGLKPGKSPVVFVRALNDAMTSMFGAHTSIEFVEFLARGEIPIPLAWPYRANVFVGRRVFELARATQWSRFREILNEAIAKKDAVDLLASERYRTRMVLAQAYKLVEKSVEFEHPIEESAAKFDSELASLESQLKDLSPPPQLPAPSRSRLLDVLNRLNPFASKDPRIEPRADTHVLVTPRDLALYVHDWKFEQTQNSNGYEHYYMYWLKDLITKDYGSSGYSMNGERRQLREWIYIHFPKLMELKVPEKLSGEESYLWWVTEAEKLVGPRVALPRVPFEDVEVYHEGARGFYADWLGVRYSAFFSSKDGKENWHGPSFQNASLASAYAVLGIKDTATLAEVKSAYRSLALEHHPDRNQNGREGAEERMRQINAAYDLIIKWIEDREFDFE